MDFLSPNPWNHDFAPLPRSTKENRKILSRSGDDPHPEVSLDHTDAWVFDLDGVLTDTASLHERVWTELFCGLFAHQAGQGALPASRSFTGADYHRLVDGESRMDGIRNVLADREITLPQGHPDDLAGNTSIWALANDKDARYLALLATVGPRPFASSVDLLRRLRNAGVGVAIVSASRHCAHVLDVAGLNPLVDVRVDGETAEVLRLPGKPDPAMFVEAARRLGVDPSRAAVVEDALAGVEAGRRGTFAVVVGVDRTNQANALREHGADVVVKDLGNIILVGSGPRGTP